MMKTVSKVRFFTGIHQDIAILENEINQWLADNPAIEIKQLAQSEFGSKTGWDIVVSVLYTTSFDT
jgi:hypothetical protein